MLVQQSLTRMEDLQRLVAQRTAALEEANRQIKKEMADRQRMEVELRHSQKLEAVGQLAAGIAHEINTPIQFIGDSVHFLREAFGDLLGLIATYRAFCQQSAGGGGVLPAALAAAAEATDLAYLEEQVPLAVERTQEGVDRV